MTDKNSPFGVNLKMLRKKSGYTRAQLAEKISYSEKSVEKWESGSSVPPVSTVCKLAQIFGVTVDSLVLPRNVDISYLLGIDAGGTKTEFLLTDINGNEIARAVLGAANPVNTGMENTVKILEQGISRVCGNINRREISMFAGIAGGISGNNKSVINKALSGFGFGAFDNGSDTDNALETALKGSDGAVVIMGTGIVGFCQTGGVRHRVGGWGYLIDKGGSGFTLGSDALDCALKYLDGRGGSKNICQNVEKRLNKPLTDCISDIYAGGAAYVASFAPAVFEAFETGDREAEMILDRNAHEAAKVIRASCEFLKSDRKKAVLCGGMCQRRDILEPFISRYLGEGITLEFSREPMVNGAVSLAKAIKEVM